MKRTFTLNGFDIATFTDLRAKVTFLTIVKDEEVLLNTIVKGAPFAINYEEIIKNL